jgi:hypothetical protein
MKFKTFIMAALAAATIGAISIQAKAEPVEIWMDGCLYRCEGGYNNCTLVGCPVHTQKNQTSIPAPKNKTSIPAPPTRPSRDK